MEKIKTALDAIKDGLNWLIENKDSVQTALKVIAGGFALLKVGEIASNIGRIVNGLKGLWPSGGGGGAVTGGGGAATGGAAVGGGALTGLKNALTGMTAKVGSSISTAGLTNAGFVADWFLHNTNTGRAINPEYGGSLSLDNLMNGFWETVNEWAAGQVKYEQEVNAMDMLFGNGRQRLAQEAQEQEARAYYFEKHSQGQGDALTEEEIAEAQRRWSEMSEIERKLFMQQHQTTQRDMEQEWLSDHTFWSDGSGSSSVKQAMDDVAQSNDKWASTVADMSTRQTQSADNMTSAAKGLETLPEALRTAVEGAVRDGMSGITIVINEGAVDTIGRRVGYAWGQGLSALIQ